MTESVATSNDADAAAKRASEQARLRKERREAKLKAGGSARLNKITGMGGRPQLDMDSTPPTTTSTPPPAEPVAAGPPPPAPGPGASDADPDEVDISQHYYAPQSTNRVPSSRPAASGPEPAISEAALRQMMLGMDPNAPGPQGQGQPPFGPGMMGPGGEDDPIMKMMQQMMGGSMPGFPPGGAAGAGMPNIPGFPPQQQQQPADPYTSVWRVLHAIVAFGLGLYIAILTPFAGTKVEREHAAALDVPDEENERRRQLFFWVFATAEALLLSTRFFLDKSRSPPPGIVWTIVRQLPGPLGRYAAVVLRYGQMFLTVRADILACIFVLGVCSWWRA